MAFWWTSDLHFDHSNMIQYEKRPYNSVEEMNEDFIRRINKYVKKGDVLYLAGDVTLHHKTQLVYDRFINPLNGNKIILKGNHDYWIGKHKGRHIDTRKINGVYMVTCHYPLRSWNRSIHGSIQVHGHCHGHLYPFRNQVDISIDNAYRMLGEYRPFGFDDIMGILKARKFKSKIKYAFLRQLRKLEAWLSKEEP